MSPKLITFLRSLGTVVAFAVLGFAANVTNLADIVSPPIAAVIAALAASALAAWDHSKSAPGTIGFGSVGTPRY